MIIITYFYFYFYIYISRASAFFYYVNNLKYVDISFAIAFYCILILFLYYVAPKLKPTTFEYLREFVPFIGSYQNFGLRVLFYYAAFILLCILNMYLESDYLYIITVTFMFAMIITLNLYFLISSPYGYLLLLVMFRGVGFLSPYLTGGARTVIMIIYASFGKRLENKWSIPFVELITIISIIYTCAKNNKISDIKQKLTDYFDPGVTTGSGSMVFGN